MAEGKTKRARARPKGRAAMGTPAQRRKIEAGVEALYDAVALGKGRLRDPMSVNRRLSELRAVMLELIGSVPTVIEQEIAKIQSGVIQWAHGKRGPMKEAEALFAAVYDDDFPTIARRMREHPPSPDTIGFLVLIARDRYKAEILSEAARLAADAAHHEDRTMREQAIAHYRAHRIEYANKDRAAEAIAGKVVPAKFSTVRGWLRNI